MATVEAPVIGAELDPSDPAGTMQSIVLGVLGVALTFGILAGGQSVYNRFVAGPTGEEVLRKSEVI